MTPADAAARDAADPLRGFRTRFALPDGVVYLDGNSLGPPPRAAEAALIDLARRQWGDRLIRSWNEGWFTAPERIGAKLARIIGAGQDEVIVADSTSVNLFKLIVAALRRDPDRRVVVAEAGNFPTDLHVAAAAIDCVPGARLDIVARGALVGALDDETALLVLAHVHYRTGEAFDLSGWTAAAHRAGALILWDLSHSVGAVPMALAAADVDCAVGCGYKYLNGGPGAPAFLHVARRWHQVLINPIAGWMGHAAPFGFTDDHQQAEGMRRWLTGTPAITGLVALEAGVDLMLEADAADIATKSAALFDAALAAGNAIGLSCLTPIAPDRRGSHIAFRHREARAISAALIARGVIGDFRPPDILRFGLTPLYLGFEDLRRGFAILAEIVATDVFSDVAPTSDVVT